VTARAVIVGVVVATSLFASHGATQEHEPPRSAVDSSRGSRASADTALEALTRKVAAELRCPVCQGLSLADSPSELALEMKDVVRSQLAAGRTPDEVKSYFVAKYGEWVLLEPPRRGVNLLAYLLPVVALAAGLGVIWLMLKRWTSGGPPAEQPALPNGDD
jgi:cytochrome c-type biogenesis protein CcmH